MPITWNLQSLGVALSEAALAYEANAPLPPAPDMTEADILAAGQTLQAKLPGWVAWLAAHPGAITGAVIFLKALGAMGFPGMTTAAAIVNALPGALQAANKYLPDALEAMTLLQPAPQPMGGGDSPHPGWGGRGG